jgi:GrpB-like predicted nucleotidyltransferase (UPF0157 family)
MMEKRNDVIGLEQGVVRLEPYTPEWKRIFEIEKIGLRAKLGNTILDIQHVGSTSIPGLPAKPIIDIAVAVVDFDEAMVCIPLVEALGYEYRGEFGIPRRHYFTKGAPRTFHLHMVEIDSAQWQNLLLFRDYLNKHPQVAEEYTEVKTQLALKYPQNREVYLEGKASFIEKVIQLARFRV